MHPWSEKEFAFLSKRLIELEMGYDIFKISPSDFIIKRNNEIMAKYNIDTGELTTYGSKSYAILK